MKNLFSVSRAVSFTAMLCSLVAVFSLQASESKKVSALKKAPAFSGTDLNGVTRSLEDYQGKIVVLEWINPDCPFVVRHYKEGTMTSLAAKYADQGVVWLAVNSHKNHDLAKNTAWSDKQKFSYPLIHDQAGEIGKLFGAKTTPHMFVINRDGNLIYDGAIDDDPSGEKSTRKHYVTAAIEAALAGASPATKETKAYGCSVKYAN